MQQKELNIPPLDLTKTKETETATFAMGCFWSPDALFGSVDAVISTRVGYTGGTTANPTYWTLADHIETVQVDYNPSKTDYRKLLHLFFSSHKPTRSPWKRQYTSAVFFHSSKQEQQAKEAKTILEETSGEKFHTEVYPYRQFYLAEERHQKYKLQRMPALMEEFQEMYPDMTDLVRSTAAARVNAYLYGYGNIENLHQEIHQLGLSPAGQALLLEKVTFKNNIRCNS